MNNCNCPNYSHLGDIDLVYLWVNGNDPKWIAKHNACIGITSDQSDVNCAGRYTDSQELKYSLRSIEKYAPWIHRIFIVTDDQVPSWLDTSNPKIQIVDHTEILPEESRPCFNSTLLEHHLHKIPGLAERYIYANDDMLLNRPVTPATFFAEDGLPIMRMNRRPLRKFTLWFKEKVQRRPLGNYLKTIHNSALLAEKYYGKYYGAKIHHNIDAYLKSSVERTRARFDDAISKTLTHHIRSCEDYQRNIYTYAALSEGEAHLRYVNQHESFRFHIDNLKHYNKLQKYNPIFFCMNDSQYATDADRKRSAEFLESMFPQKSKFEK